MEQLTLSLQAWQKMNMAGGILQMELLIGITKAWQKISMENGALVMEQLTLVTTV